MKLELSNITKLRWAAISCASFALAIGFLIGTPTAVELAESKVLNSTNQPQDKSIPLISEVAGAQKAPEFELVSNNIAPPSFSSYSVYALDMDSGKVLFDKNSAVRLSPASTTKIMTALVAVEYFKPADILTVFSTTTVGGSTMDLSIGEKLTFRSLLYGMLLNSGNDASFTIAANYPGGLDAFIARMNQKAQELGAINTHFQNPAGFDHPSHYSSAQDLAIITKEAIKNFQIARVVATKETSVSSFDQSTQHTLKNLNVLLNEPGVIGVKTGYTDLAGENFVGLVERQNRQVLTVVLSSQDRFGETKLLMDWVFANYSWIEK